jgi:hypothetical protein
LLNVLLQIANKLGLSKKRVVIKGIPPTALPKAIQDELFALGFSVQNVIPKTAETELLCQRT